ncbi:MAG: SCO family protein [Candidatus Caldarchaeum sp.]
MKRRVLLFVAAAVVAVAAGAFASYAMRTLISGYKPPIEIPGEKVLPDFRLTDQNGQPFTLSSIRGKKAVLIYFGYTHCPDVCPTVLSKFAKAISTLGPKADEIAFLLVTVDPERDTPEAMKKYISYYSDKILGLTGSPEEVANVLKLYNVYAAKNPPDEKGNYLVDHFALVLGADRNHVLRIALTVEMPPDEYVEGVKWLLSK